MKIRTYTKPPLSEDKISRVINILRKIYGIFMIIGSIYIFFLLVSLLIRDSSDFKQRDTWEALLSIFIFAAIYFGLRKQIKWVVPLILIVSAFSLIGIAVDIITPAENMQMIIGKLFSVAALLFSIYQIKFFSRREVKSYFNTKGFVLFQ